MALIIRGVIDGPLSGGVPKAIELFALADIADLSVYGLESANNGNPAAGPEFTLSGSIGAGESLFVASEVAGFQAFFGFAPTDTGAVANINGDDAIALYLNGSIVDVFGEIGTDGTGRPWDHLDGWAVRKTLTGPSTTFDATDWTFSGTNALDGETTNATAGSPYPLNTGTPASQPIRINEVLVSTAGADLEFIEFTGAPGASLDGLSLINIEADPVGNGVGGIDNRFDFGAGDVIGDNGFFLAANSLAANSLATPNATLPANFFENSSSTIALVETASLSGTTVTGTETVIDAVALTDGSGTPTFFYGAPVVGPDGTFYPSAVGRTAVDGPFELINAFSPAGANTTPTAGTFGPVDPDAPVDVKIHAIQGATDLPDGTLVGVAGAADESPLLGQSVRVQGVVTKVLPGLGGFYVQEEDTDADADAATSEGIFVASAASVAEGQIVTVEGTVAEVEGETRIAATAVTVDDAGDNSALVTPTVITFPTATVLRDADGDFVANLEAYEGMLVTVAQDMTVTELFQLDRFGTIRLSSGGRLEQFTQNNAPDAAGYVQHLKDVAARSLVLDDGSDIQNPSVIHVPGLGTDETLDAGDVLRMGDAYTNLTGVLSFSEDDQSGSEEPEYRLHRADGTLESRNPRTDAPAPVGSDFKVAALNVLNFFTTLNTAGNQGVGPNNLDARGANTSDEYARQLSKLVEALTAMDADVIGLIEIENDFGASTPPIQALVDAVNATLGDAAYDWVRPNTGNFVGGDAIAVGFIYDTRTVELVGDAAVLDAATFVDPNGTGGGLNRAALAASFEDKATGGVFTAAVNHFKSKGASGLAAGDATNPDSDQGDGAGFWNDTRTKAALALADWLDTYPTGVADEDIMILGDLNAYAQETPITTLAARGYTDLAGEFLGDDAYSFVFDGQTGTLDYALANASLTAQVTGVTEWHVNADEADIFDYNLDFGRDPTLFTTNADTNVADGPYRNADHDPVIVGLNLKPEVFTLELLHLADQEAGIPALEDAPRASAVMAALEAQDLGNDGIADNTIRLSSGDAIIPGLFFSASQEVFGGAGRADILIQNELGFQAIAFGNHEFDLGTGLLADLIGGDADDGFVGAQFPYLSSNLDVSTDANLAPFVTDDAEAPKPNSIAASTVIDVNGEKIGVVGATTPTLRTISSPGGVTIFPAAFDGDPTSDQLDALAAEIQKDVDALLAANPGLNKVVLLAHMQQISIEQALAERLTDVDIIVAGGSNTRLLDDNDTPRDGEAAQGPYPIFKTAADGKPVAIVNTDGNYKYVGRLVIDFDGNGVIIPESYDETVSGAYRTDEAGVAALGAEGLIDPEIQSIVDALEEVILATESNVFGVSDVYLNGLRPGVRQEETNLGNLTADANLAEARKTDPSVVISLKNGGGIRDDIGRVIVPAGGTGEAEFLPNEAIPGVKPAGGISQTDIGNALRFNNGLTLLTVDAEGLKEILEYSVAASTLDNQQGRFPQVSGVQFSFDLEAEPGARVRNVSVVNEDGFEIAVVRDGVVLDPAAEFRMVTLGFLAGGGDGYPFPTVGKDFVDLVQPDEAPRSGAATFAADGSEQDALAEYLFANFLPDNGGVAYGEADTARALDTRLQNLTFREDDVLDDAFTLVEGTEGRDTLVGTGGNDLIISKGGLLDRVSGLGGADAFFFGDELTNGVKERTIVTDYSLAEGDTLHFAQDIDSIQFSARQAVITLEGDGDRVFVQGRFDSADDLMIFTPSSAFDQIA